MPKKRQLRQISRACGCVLTRIPNSKSKRAPRGRTRTIKYCTKHKPDGFMAGLLLGVIIGSLGIGGRLRNILEGKDDTK
jgi:hypothetical protein